MSPTAIPGYSLIHAAVGAEHVPDDALDISLPVSDPNRLLAVGRDGTRAFVLVGPGQPSTDAMNGKQFRFDPWTKLYDRKTGATFRDVSILRFRPEEEVGVRDAVAAVFAGLVDLASATPLALGPAIEAMKALFESGLRSQVPRDIEIGLAGELLAVAEAADPGWLAKTWHTDSEDQFDFSAQGERLEVKTTCGSSRQHWFSSGQLEPIPGVCTSYLSLLLPVVEVGSTVASVFADLNGLTADELARVRSRIIAIAQEPPELLTTLVFDRTAATASMLHLSPAMIPRPTPAPGVGRMRWEATIPSDSTGPGENCRYTKALG